MKTLIVDDEPVSRKKMEKIMSTLGECFGADGGTQALTVFKQALNTGAPFDIVTLDVSMPEMDGRHVLLAIRSLEERKRIPREKRSKVVMVTCRADKETVVTCIQSGCDEYVVKPFDRGVMAKKFMKLGIAFPAVPAESPTCRLVMETVEKFQGGRLESPPIPPVLQGMQDGAGEKSGGVEQLARIVEKDAVISERLLSAADSPMSGAKKHIEKLVTAIRQMGLTPSREMAAALECKRLFNTRNRRLLSLMQKLWLHSLACACCAKAVHAAIDEPLSETAAPPTESVFMTGLVHDIGCVLLLRGLGENREFQAVAFDRAELLRSAQEAHASLGVALLERWGFSKSFLDAVRCHEWSRFPEGTEQGLLITNLADHLASSIGLGFFRGEKAELPGLDSARLLQLGPEPLERIRNKARAMMEESLTVLQ